MSRSVKKNHIFKDHAYKGKELANRKLRRKFTHIKEDEEPRLYNGKSYRKVTDPWDISDYSFRYEDYSKIIPGKDAKKKIVPFEKAKWEDKKIYKK